MLSAMYPTRWKIRNTSIPSLRKREKIELGPRAIVLFWHSRMIRIYGKGGEHELFRERQGRFAGIPR